eukprot:109902_1
MSAELANADDVPEITTTDVYYLASLYGIKSHMISFVKSLPSYDDCVFHIGIHPQFVNKETNTIPLVLKCSINNALNRVDMQIQLMHRLYANDVPSPKPIPLCPQHRQTRTKYNEYIYQTTNNPLQNERTPTAKRKVNVHCMSYIQDGLMAADVDKTDVSFLSNVGQSVGKLSLALKGFQHTASDFAFVWDLRFASTAFPKMELIHNDQRKQLVQTYIDHYNRFLLPFVVNKRLRTSIIHGDLNDMNMLCNAKGNQKRIIGFFDFGDSKLSCTVFDIAICAAYFMLKQDKATALMIMYQLLQGYHRIYPLTDDEINVFFVAVCTRMLVSALVGNEKIVLHPENREYLEVHSKPAWTLLEQFADTNPMDITNTIKRKLCPSRL